MKSLFFALAVVLLGATACQNTVNTIENTNKEMAPNVIQDSRFITDGFLSDRLGVRQVILNDNEAGLKVAQIQVVNLRTGVFSQALTGMTSENPYPVAYRFTWFDRDGIVVRNINNNWKRIKIHPGEITYITEVAPSVHCADFQISLKEVK